MLKLHGPSITNFSAHEASPLQQNANYQDQRLWIGKLGRPSICSLSSFKNTVLLCVSPRAERGMITSFFPTDDLPASPNGYVAVLRVDHKFVNFTNIAIFGLYPCATPYGQFSWRNLLMLHGYLHCPAIRNIRKV